MNSTISLPPPESLFWKQIALHTRSKHWPERFGNRIPLRIKMNMTVRPDFAFILPPEKRGMILIQNEIYIATANSHGAVCGICECGHELGVKPDEFEVEEWYSPEGAE